MSSKIYPIGIQNFEKIRKEGYFYIDKTALIYKLVKTGSYYFLSRPRRFGKSLLLSTLEAYFKGRKELFEGLAMESLEKDWIEYPVIHLDLNAKKFDTENDLIRLIDRQLLVYEAQYGSCSSDETIDDRLVTLIRLAAEKTGQRVVILVDEYDKPMLQAIGRDELQEEYRNTLKAFYGVMKSMDGYIKFAMLTGVTKFGKVSVFSDLNNLNDISMWNQYIDICGVSDQELHDNLEVELSEFADARGMTYNEICVALREYYDGYHFTHNSIGMYNPFSLLNAFLRNEFGSYWFETGTPTYLVELLKKHHYDLQRMAHEETSAEVLNSVDSTSDNPIPVIYQSGYLTIKDYDPEFGLYTLDYPNREVEEGFVKYLMPFYIDKSEAEAPFEIRRFVGEVRNGNIDGFFHRLQSFFADAPYEVIVGQDPVRNVELFFQNVLFIVFRLAGFYTQVEYHTSRGRIDLVLKTDKFIYVMEFKQGATAEEALAQINEKGYADAFASDSRTLYKIGVSFSDEQRNIERWLAE
mgnify:CR=1 FL=1